MHSAYDFLFQASLDICLEFGFPKKRDVFDVRNFVTRICTLIFLNILMDLNSQLKTCLCFVELLGEMFNLWMKVLLLHIAFACHGMYVLLDVMDHLCGIHFGKIHIFLCCALGDFFLYLHKFVGSHGFPPQQSISFYSRKGTRDRAWFFHIFLVCGTLCILRQF